MSSTCPVESLDVLSLYIVAASKQIWADDLLDTVQRKSKHWSCRCNL